MKKVLISYVPVLHDGYLRFFSKYAANVDALLIFSRALAKEFTYLEEEIRAVDPEVMVKVIKTLDLFKNVLVLEAHMINYICRDYEIIAVDDGISRRLVKKYIPVKKNVEFDSAFLRWDETNVISSKPAGYHRESHDVFDREMMILANREAQKSSDWWRHVGAVAVKNKKILFTAYNQHLPSEHTPYVFGDPRDFIEAGKQSDIATSLHAEQAIIIKAARLGVILEGADIYVSVFPCPMCAKPVALAGFVRCFFASGHASLNGEEIMKSRGVEIIYVN